MGSTLTLNQTLCLLGLFPNPKDDTFELFFFFTQSAFYCQEAFCSLLNADTLPYTLSLVSGSQFFIAL